MTEATTEEKTFEPITTQEEFDARLGKRLAAEREKWEKGSEVADLREQLAAKEREATAARAEGALAMEMEKRGLTRHGKDKIIRRLVDLDSETPVSEQIAELSREAPDLFRMPRGSGSGGSTKPIKPPGEEPLTEEDVAKMSAEEMAKPGMMERIDRFMKGER
jgi:hypothetical protein